jgi:DNA polymerase III delta prime subunit
MKGSILVYGGNAKRRSNIYERLLLEDLSLGKLTNNPDILTVDKEDKKSIGISQIRELINFINEKPFTHKKKAAIVVGAHTMTIQAQNALLKTLEELPSYASIILDSKNLSSILLTVQSRCQKIDARGWGREETSGDVSTENILDILDMHYGDRLVWADGFSKEELDLILETLESWIAKLESELDYRSAHNIETITNVKEDLEDTNVNTKLALEHLVLSLK